VFYRNTYVYLVHFVKRYTCNMYLWWIHRWINYTLQFKIIFIHIKCWRWINYLLLKFHNISRHVAWRRAMWACLVTQLFTFLFILSTFMVLIFSYLFKTQWYNLHYLILHGQTVYYVHKVGHSMNPKVSAGRRCTKGVCVYYLEQIHSLTLCGPMSDWVRHMCCECYRRSGANVW
jgi:hypothetical protein